jgi:hypothetical protein
LWEVDAVDLFDILCVVLSPAFLLTGLAMLLYGYDRLNSQAAAHRERMERLHRQQAMLTDALEALRAKNDASRNAQPGPDDGPTTPDQLRRLYAAPGDGAALVRFTAEGGIREG